MKEETESLFLIDLSKAKPVKKIFRYPYDDWCTIISKHGYVTIPVVSAGEKISKQTKGQVFYSSTIRSGGAKIMQRSFDYPLYYCYVFYEGQKYLVIGNERNIRQIIPNIRLFPLKKKS